MPPSQPSKPNPPRMPRLPRKLYLSHEPKETPMNANPFPGAEVRAPRFDFIGALLAPYREPRTDSPPAHLIGTPAERTTAAPPWAADVAQAVKRATPNPDHPGIAFHIGEYVLAWCARGEPVSRASMILAYLALWRGPHKLEALEGYVEAMIGAKAGRPKGCEPRPFRAPETFATWDEADMVKEQRAFAREHGGPSRTRDSVFAMPVPEVPAGSVKIVKEAVERRALRWWGPIYTNPARVADEAFHLVEDGILARPVCGRMVKSRNDDHQRVADISERSDVDRARPSRGAWHCSRCLEIEHANDSIKP